MLSSFKATKRLNLQNISKACFSKHSNFLIVGGGTAGVNAAHQLLSSKMATRHDITIIDPAAHHYYQPGFTKIGGGVVTNSFILNNFIQYDMKKVCSFVNFENKAVKTFLPDENAVTTDDGERYTYNRLIVTAGLQVNSNGLPGLHDLLEDPNSKVCTIYGFNYAHKTHRLVSGFQGGKAVFTQHPAPIKCAGAPQKILYLAQDNWEKDSKTADIHFYTPLPKMFGVGYYADTLNKIADRKGINRHHGRVLQEVTSEYAIFKNTASGEIERTRYDFLHVTPPMSAPSFLKGQPIADASGFVETTPEMRHKKYPNIYAAGDCVTLPCAKTASAVFAQLPILIQNMKKDIEASTKNDGKFNGYSACPIYIDRGHLMMAEFKTFEENGVAITTEDETFFKGHQTTPRRDFYYIAKAFTFIYYISLRRNWYGNNFFIRPNYDGIVNKNDYTAYYKYVLLTWPYATGLLLFYLYFR